MARSTFTVRRLAAEAGIDEDVALILLWEDGKAYDYVDDPTSIIRNGDTSRARRLVGLATRRELESKAAWQSVFELDDADFRSLLETLGVRSSQNDRLPKKAISRLRFEAQNRGLVWPGAVSPRTNGTDKVKGNLARRRTDAPPLNWRLIGRVRDVDHLSDDDVHDIHKELVVDFANANDPIKPPGIRDEHLLASALMRPMTSLEGERKYPTVEMAAAALLHSLIHNHPFHNGNKRTALVSMLAFLDHNRVLVTCAEGELFKLVTRVASHSIVPSERDQRDDREVMSISEWISRNSRRIQLGDRSIQFRRFCKLLAKCDCDCSSPRNNQVQINREIRKRRLFRDQIQTLSTYVAYHGEGREINRAVVAKARRDLQIDEPHGIDSAAFYHNAPAAADEFINKYRKTLSRLARL